MLSSLEVINSAVNCERRRSLSTLSVYDIYLLKDLAFCTGTHSVIPRLTFSFLSSHTVFWPLSNCWRAGGGGGLRVSPVCVSEPWEWASQSRREGLSAWKASNFGAEHERRVSQSGQLRASQADFRDICQKLLCSSTTVSSPPCPGDCISVVRGGCSGRRWRREGKILQGGGSGNMGIVTPSLTSGQP